MIDPTAIVKTKNIGQHTTVWQYAVIMEKAVIGDFCNINCHTFIENDVVLGDRVTVKSGVYLWDGMEIENDVFIGPNVTFTNDPLPRSKQRPTNFQKITIRKNASIGAAAIVLGGVEIGAFAMIGAGALVTKNVPARALVVGSPGRVVGWLNDDGSKMNTEGTVYRDVNGNLCEWNGNELLPV